MIGFKTKPLRFLVSLMLLLPLWANAKTDAEASADASANTTANTSSSAITESSFSKLMSEDSTWVIVGGVSRHSCRDCGFHERNPGLALQWRSDWLNNFMQSDNWRVSAGTYLNSNNRHSLYVATVWQPLSYTMDAVSFKAGVQMAVISNYLKSPITPTLLPTLTLETKHLGADLYLVPKFPSVSSAVLVSFKVRF
ncbi:MAG TPA: hypothetical protein PKC80_11955 [Burkholderiaceae bacterium]|nr:hypothetical protein [Burkholderiaceae bacterium]